MNMYRVTTDVHDNWGALKTAFAASTTYANKGLEGAVGLQGKSWVDHDMLALGYVGCTREAASFQTSRTLLECCSAVFSPWAHLSNIVVECPWDAPLKRSNHAS